MAIINTTLFDYQIADLTRKQITRVSPTDCDGKVRVAVDNYLVTSSSAGDYIALFKLPKGAKLISCEIFTLSSGPTAATLGVGTIGPTGIVTATEPSKYSLTEIDLSGQGRIQMVAKPFLVPDYVLSNESVVILGNTFDSISTWAFSFVGLYVTGS